jgi:membrane protein CcdC involved in cytochrome C biogenesis
MQISKRAWILISRSFLALTTLLVLPVVVNLVTSSEVDEQHRPYLYLLAISLTSIVAWRMVSEQPHYRAHDLLTVTDECCRSSQIDQKRAVLLIEN